MPCCCCCGKPMLFWSVCTGKANTSTGKRLDNIHGSSAEGYSFFLNYASLVFLFALLQHTNWTKCHQCMKLTVAAEPKKKKLMSFSKQLKPSKGNNSTLRVPTLFLKLLCKLSANMYSFAPCSPLTNLTPQSMTVLPVWHYIRWNINSGVRKYFVISQ